jgi:hypothetical protein
MAGIAAGVTPVAGVWPKVNTFAHVPKTDPDGARCMVTVGDIRRVRTRMTPPRGAGRVERVYTVDVLVYATHDDAQKGGDAFDTLAENVEAVFTAAPGTPTVTDAVTKVTSQIMYTAENVDLHLLTPDVNALGGKVQFRALLAIEVREIIVG